MNKVLFSTIMLACSIFLGLLLNEDLKRLDDIKNTVQPSFYVSLANGEKTLCKTKSFINPKQQEKGIYLYNCENDNNYQLERYVINDDCFDYCPEKPLKNKLNCYNSCSNSYPDKKIILYINEISSF